MTRSERRAARIRISIPIDAVLSMYGYDVRTDVGVRQQQFSCDLHGDGTDSKPSARCYPATGQWYCWACARSRDAIATVREKENLDFVAALQWLERRFALPPLPWEEEDRAPDKVDVVVSPEVTFADEARRTCAFLKGLHQERSLSVERLAGLWAEYDRIVFSSEAAPEDALDTLRAFRWSLLNSGLR